MLAGVSLLLSILAVLSLIGIFVYFYTDIDKHKVSNIKDFNSVKTEISNEKTDRLGNLAYVIDQVNTVNKDIKKTYDSANTAQDVKITNLGTRIDGVESGFGSLLSINSVGSSSNIPLSSLASVSQPDIKLIKNISVVSGMTIKEVQASKQFKVCGGTPEKCISFPDTNGNTYLTGFGTTSSIVLDAQTQVNQDISFGKYASFNNDLRIKQGDTTIGTIGIGTGNSLQIASPNTIRLQGNVNVIGTLNVSGDTTYPGKLTRADIMSMIASGNVGMGTTGGNVGMGTTGGNVGMGTA